MTGPGLAFFMAFVFPSRAAFRLFPMMDMLLSSSEPELRSVLQQSPYPTTLAVTTRYDKHIIRVEEATIRQGIFDRHKPVL